MKIIIIIVQSCFNKFITRNIINYGKCVDNCSNYIYNNNLCLENCPYNTLNENINKCIDLNFCTKNKYFSYIPYEKLNKQILISMAKSY